MPKLARSTPHVADLAHIRPSCANILPYKPRIISFDLLSPLLNRTGAELSNQQA